MMPERERKGQWSCETYKRGKFKTERQIAFSFLLVDMQAVIKHLVPPPYVTIFLIIIFLISWYKFEVKPSTPTTDRQHLSVALRPLQFLLGGGQKGGGVFKPFTTDVLSCSHTHLTGLTHGDLHRLPLCILKRTELNIKLDCIKV